MQNIIIISIFVISCALLIAAVLFNIAIPFGGKYIKFYYWMAPLLGAIMMLICKGLSIEGMFNGLTSSGSINPIKILILFISMTTLSIFLDEAGFFSYVSEKALGISGSKQITLFTILFVLVSVLTVFTSNDIIILTFTPFICYFSKKSSIDPMPYLFGEFVAANTWSMMLIIGNPTNIYLASSVGIGFGEYIKVMWLPTILAGVVAYLLLLLIFCKQLKKPMVIEKQQATLRSRGYIALGLIHLGLCTVLLVVSSYIGLEMWYITLGFAISLFVCVTFYQKKKRIRDKVLLHTINRAPWELIPFVLSMFVLVLALEENGITIQVCKLLGEDNLVMSYGISSFLAANVMNNIPMAVAFSAISKNLSNGMLEAVFASIIGSNLGAYLTPIGALAGIMWSGILKAMGITITFPRYVWYGIRIAVPVLLTALIGLMIVF